MTLRVRVLEDLLGWLLSWGDQVQVLEPAGLQQRLRESALAIAARYAAR